MKRYALFLLAALAVVPMVLTSCSDGRRALAKSVKGSWSTDQLQLFNDAQGQASGEDIFTFVVDPANPDGGTVNIVSTISVMRIADQPISPENAFSVSVAATSTIDGHWTATDDDEIDIVFDSSSFKVTVDPDAVALVANPLSGTSQPEVDSLRQQMADLYQMQLSNAMRSHYSAYTSLDDVKVRNKGAVLKFEVGKTDYILRSQNQ